MQRAGEWTWEHWETTDGTPRFPVDGGNLVKVRHALSAVEQLLNESDPPLDDWVRPLLQLALARRCEGTTPPARPSYPHVPRAGLSCSRPRLWLPLP